MAIAQWLSPVDAAALVQDGQTVALGGFTIYRRPVAFVRELLRRDPRPKDLTLLCFTAGYESDLLVGAGCVRTMRTVYFGLESFGFAPMFTEKANRGEIEICEETESSIAMGLRARMAGVGFMPSTAWIGTDLPRLRPDVKTVTDPYTGEELMAFPAIPVDVAVLHGLEGDTDGNFKLNNNLGIGDRDHRAAGRAGCAQHRRHDDPCAGRDSPQPRAARRIPNLLLPRLSGFWQRVHALRRCLQRGQVRGVFSRVFATSVKY
jgi:acyl CoA:acetate/3-ketoacid CoA transferase alpha subunit